MTTPTPTYEARLEAIARRIARAFEEFEDGMAEAMDILRKEIPPPASEAGVTLGDVCPEVEARRLLSEMRQHHTRVGMADALRSGSIVECSCGAFVARKYVPEHTKEARGALDRRLDEHARLTSLTKRATPEKGGER